MNDLSMFITPASMIFVVVLIITQIVQFNVRSKLNKYTKVDSLSGISGAEVAKYLLEQNNVNGVEIILAKRDGEDYYDPRAKRISLSRSNYLGSSVTALSVAAHETGHALQHAYGYAPLNFRTTILPIASFSSNVSVLIFGIGMASGIPSLTDIGLICMLFGILFSVLTLPVEFNASSRAKKMLTENNFITQNNVRGVQSVLGAAALTYVASTAALVVSFLVRLAQRNSRRN